MMEFLKYVLIVLVLIFMYLLGEIDGEAKHEREQREAEELKKKIINEYLASQK